MMFNAFYSDPHFWHKNIIKYAERPFVDHEDTHEHMMVS